MTGTKYPAAILLHASLLLLLCGCPYEAEFPLGAVSEAKIDKDLIGEWKFDPKKKDENPSIFVLCPFNDHEYVVVRRGTKGEDDIDLMRATVTTIADAKFLSVQGIDVSSPDKKEKWAFVRYSVSSEALTIQVVEEKCIEEKIGTAADLRAFIEKNLKNKDLYDNEMVLNRIKK